MNAAELKAAIFDCLHIIAPEADPAALAPTENIRDALDIDSYDFLRFLIALSGKLGVEIPEADYARLTTLESMTGYLGQSIFPAAPSVS